MSHNQPAHPDKEARKKPRKYGRTDEHERKAVPIFEDEFRQQLLADSRQGFVKAILQKIDTAKHKPEDIVDEARQYYKRRHEDDLKANKPRPSHWLNSASTALTHIKAGLKQQRLGTYTFRREVALSRAELLHLDKLNYRRLEQRIHHQPEIDLRELMEKLYSLLASEEPEEICLGIAGLTGRRQTEVTYSIQLSEPKSELRHRYPSFWAHVTGFSKKRAHDRYAVRARELPLLAPREMIVEAIRELRQHWPSDSHAEASALYGKRLARAHKLHLAPLGVQRMHDLRKTFAQLAYEHFNERDSVLPAFASAVLAHKRPLSKRIMTYLIIRTKNSPSLQEIFGLAKCGLLVCNPEPHERLQAGHAETPVFRTPPAEVGGGGGGGEGGRGGGGGREEKKTSEELMPPPPPRNPRRERPLANAGKMAEIAAAFSTLNV